MPAFQYLKTLDEKVDPQNSAVIVIDVQNDFLAEGGFADVVGWPISNNQRAVEPLKLFLVEARQAKTPVIFVNSTYDEVFLSYPMLERNKRHSLQAPRCLSGSWGADFYGVRPEPGEVVVTKHRYSAFVDTELNAVLRAMNVQTLILTGVYTEVCVESTARDGYFQDYYIVMVEDCCATTMDDFHNNALARCERDYGVVASSDEIIATWRDKGQQNDPPVEGNSDFG